MSKQQIKYRRLKRMLYSTRRREGVDADLYVVTVNAPDYTTGSKGITTVKHRVRDFVSYSAVNQEKFQYALGFVRANSNFTYGGYFEVGDRIGIIDGSTIDVEPTIKDYIVYESRRYDIASVSMIGSKCGWILHMRESKGNLSYQQLEKTVTDYLKVNDAYAI